MFWAPQAKGRLHPSVFQCSAEVDPACAEVLPAAKRSYGAKAPPAGRPVEWFSYTFSRSQNIDFNIPVHKSREMINLTAFYNFFGNIGPVAPAFLSYFSQCPPFVRIQAYCTRRSTCPLCGSSGASLEKWIDTGSSFDRGSRLHDLAIDLPQSRAGIHLNF